MPRTYQRKPESRKYGYSTEAMDKALTDIKENGISVKKAAFLYGLNRQTVANHLKGIFDGKVGRPTVLTVKEEKLIVHALTKLGEWGFGVGREALQTIVMDFLKNAGRASYFKNGKPGLDWVLAFESRWKDQLSRRVSQPLPANRAFACNNRVVDDFFDKLSASVDRLDIRNKPQNIFNVDETGFSTDIGKQNFYCKRGLKNPHKVVASSTKTQYTVQVCCSAAGQFLPLYVVYKGAHLYNTWIDGGPETTRYTVSQSGWMETAQFLEWFMKIFVENTKEIEGGKLLIFDGHNSHISCDVVEMAVANNIELLCLPAHTSSILQPLDVGVFKGVKSAWRKLLTSFYERTRYCNVDKRHFPPLLKELDDGGAFSCSNAVSAFNATGIYPLNRAKITAEKTAVSEPLTRPAADDISQLSLPVPSSSNANSNLASPVTSPVSVTDNPLTSTSLAATTLTPRKSLKVAMLSHLRNITPCTTGEKRSRIKRTLAESLTCDESRQRLAEMQLDKHQKVTKRGKARKKVPESKEGESLPAIQPEPENSEPSAATKKRRAAAAKLASLPTEVSSKRSKTSKVTREKKSRLPYGHTVDKMVPNAAIRVRKPVWLSSDAAVTSDSDCIPTIPELTASEVIDFFITQSSDVITEIAASGNTATEASDIAPPAPGDTVIEASAPGDTAIEASAAPADMVIEASVPADTTIEASATPGDTVIGSYVAVGYGRKWYPGIVERIDKDCGENGDDNEKDELFVKFMQIKGINKFCWPKHDDKLSVLRCDVLCALSPPFQSKRFMEFDKHQFANANAAFELWQ